MYNCDIDARHIQAKSSGPRQYWGQVKRSKPSSAIKTYEAEPGFDSKKELDTRAYTIFEGANWRLLSVLGHFCDVYGFRDNFECIKDVTISRVSIGICDEHGRVRILIVNQALYLGASLDRHFGIPVSDNLYDSGRYFVIYHDNQFIPFKS